jgi:hypothetical protein
MQFAGAVAGRAVLSHWRPGPRGAIPSHPLVSLAPVRDYGGAWSSKRGRCHRYVYTSDDDGRPTNCPEPVARSGWVWEEFTGKWHVVDACERHSAELVKRPRPGYPGRP